MSLTHTIKIITMMLLLTLLPINLKAYFVVTNVPDISQENNGNSVNVYSIPTGLIGFNTHQPGGGGDTNMMNGFDYFIRENSYSRNFLIYNFDDCSNYVGSSACGASYIVTSLSTNILIDYNIMCSPTFCGWDFSCIAHETGHCFGAGEGMLANDNPYQWISNYGDEYDPQGIGSGAGLNGHWSAPNKELFGFIGVNGYRPLLVAIGKGNASYYITGINDQSAGPKALKILKNRWVIYRTDGELYSDKREFYYLEARPNHRFGTKTTGKGKRRVTTVDISPAVQVRLAQPPYKGGEVGYARIQAKLINNIGYKGGLKAGAGFTYPQVTTAQVTYNGPLYTFTNNVSVTVLSVNTLGALISVIVK